MEYQNAQELVSVWRTIRDEIEALDGTITTAYAVLGDHGFYLVIKIPDGETAFQVIQVIERHGLDTTTIRAFEREQLGILINDR